MGLHYTASTVIAQAAWKVLQRSDRLRLSGLKLVWGFAIIRGTFLGGPSSKDYSILGSILGSLYFGKLPFRKEEMLDHTNPDFHKTSTTGSLKAQSVP